MLEFLREVPTIEATSSDEKMLQKVKEAIVHKLSDEHLSVDPGRRNRREPSAFLSQNNCLDGTACE